MHQLFAFGVVVDAVLLFGCASTVGENSDPNFAKLSANMEFRLPTQAEMKRGHMEGTEGKAHWTIDAGPDDLTTVQVQRDYDGGVPPSTAQRVWEIVADFGGIKAMFPNLVRMSLAYPDDSEASLLTVRALNVCDPEQSGQPLGLRRRATGGT